MEDGMKTYAQTPDGWEWITIPDPPPQAKTDIQILRADVALIKAKLGIV